MIAVPGSYIQARVSISLYLLVIHHLAPLFDAFAIVVPVIAVISTIDSRIQKTYDVHWSQ